MKKDLPGTVQQIARFVGKELSSELIQQIANQTSFEAMDKRGFTVHELIQNPNTKFIRKGEVGDWKNYFTEEQSRRFDEMYEKKMTGTGLELEFL